jgi:hypothetical protein
VTNAGTGSLFACALNEATTTISPNPPTPTSPTLYNGVSVITAGSQLTFKYVVTQTPAQEPTLGTLVDAGVTATCKTATGSSVTTSPALSADTSICKAPINPGISVSKTCAASIQKGTVVDGTANVAGLLVEVDFTVTIVNTGNVKLENFRITDTRTPGGTVTYTAVAFDDQTTSIAPGITKKFSKSYLPSDFGVGLTFSDTVAVASDVSISIGRSTVLTASASSSPATTCSLCP